MANGIEETTDAELEKVIGFVDEYLDATDDMRALSEKSRDYYDGYQWTADEKEELRARKQPCITNNRIKPKVQFLRGMEQQTRTDPKAFPRNPDDEQSAEVSTDMLRFISDANISEQKLSKGFKHYAVEGTEAHEVIAEQVKDKFEVKHNVIPWDRTWWDPHSREEDFSDARWLGTLQWMDTAQGKEDFPDAPETVWTLDDSGAGHGTEETHEDRPIFFTDKKRKRVRVFFCYYIKRGVWNYTIFTKSGFIQKPVPSPYIDDDGAPEPQFIFQSAFVDLDGGRYGEVASYLDLQDEVNNRRSKLLHLMSVRQTWGNKGAVGDVQAHKTEAAKPDGHLEFNVGELNKDFGFIPTNDMAAGQQLLLQESKQEIDAQGANAALAGTDERQLSGRAVQSLQQGGSVEIGPLFDGHRYCKNRIHRMMFNRAKQFWTEERWVRVTDNEEKLRFTGVNKQIRLGDQISQKFEEGGMEALTEQELVMVETNDPRLNTVVDIENPVNELDVDIIIDESIDTVTLQQEQFEELTKLYSANPNAVPFELVIKASQLRNKDELLKLIKGGTDEQQDAFAQMKQQEEQEAKEFQKAAATTQIELDQSTTQKNLATVGKTNMETKQIAVETAIDVQEATEPRIQALA